MTPPVFVVVLAEPVVVVIAVAIIPVSVMPSSEVWEVLACFLQIVPIRCWEFRHRILLRCLDVDEAAVCEIVIERYTCSCI